MARNDTVRWSSDSAMCRPPATCEMSMDCARAKALPSDPMRQDWFGGEWNQETRSCIKFVSMAELLKQQEESRGYREG